MREWNFACYATLFNLLHNMFFVSDLKLALIVKPHVNMRYMHSLTCNCRNLEIYTKTTKCFSI